MDRFHRSHTGLPSNNSLPPSGHALRIKSSGSVRPQQQNAMISHKDLPVRPRSRQTPSQLGSPEDGLTDQSLHTTATGSGSQNMPLHAAMYSRYQVKTPSEQFPSVHSQQRSTNCVQQQLDGASTAEDASSQILQRDRPPSDYSNAFYRHQLYQGRNGHLLIPSDPRVGKTQTAAINLATGEPSMTVPGKVQQKPSIYTGSYFNNSSLVGINNTSWTVMGVLRNQHLQNARQYGHSRLW